jgi:hypothetical protein
LVERPGCGFLLVVDEEAMGFVIKASSQSPLLFTVEESNRLLVDVSPL